MIVTGDTLGIGDLARLTGVPVRTIRFYCDEGVLESVRSVGGHRRFGRDTVERLDLVRRLRRLGLGLPAITSVITGRLGLADAVAAERVAVDEELAALAWRRAALRAVEEATPVDRAARLDLLAAAQDGRAAHGALTAFWHRHLTGPVPGETLSMFLDVTAPPPPADPTAAQVVAYAELVAMVADRSPLYRLLEDARGHFHDILDQAALQEGVGAACLEALPLVAAGVPPGRGPALDAFVAAHAAVRGRRDSRVFRSGLLASMAVDRGPRMRRYWSRVRVVTGGTVTLGETHAWLQDSLASSVGA
ncbi:MerR family transcriptional regulator [Saccharothrix violaceirubra]|uniref:Excisionase family DNA binding protein n=1 Tax=Saccharothrix violaceirubra TaxID=413306 RepID=A0A7W7T0E0_9PSEU|nr:MerR family transcriptional regulator [Saccharothrix violaceirubra]MBB4964269.1 excisionase family DNA binding protein [Saccharothrix violaceirubra]